jgi:hypothetical protein
MEGLLGLSQGGGAITSPHRLDQKRATYSVDLTVIKATLRSSHSDDELEFNTGNPMRALTISAQKILDRLNKMVETPPSSVEPPKPSITPERTADTVVKGIGLLFDRFAKQNQSLQGEELINEFFKRARAGVEQGYTDAFETLKDIGAFKMNGVEEQVKLTRSLIDDKLTSFENQKRREFGLEIRDTTTADVAEQVKEGLVSGSGVNLVA